MKTAIFDLDGTLLDSLDGIECSILAAMSEITPEMPPPKLRDVIGPPISVMFARTWPHLPEREIRRLVGAFRAHYLAEGCLRSVAFEGVPETLSLLHSRNIQLLVLTNKPAAPTRKILDHLGLSHFFGSILSPDSIKPAFPSKPDGARRLMEIFDLDPAGTTLIGDGIDDMESASLCGFRFVAAAYGYGAAADMAQRRIEKFSEIEGLLL